MYATGGPETLRARASILVPRDFPGVPWEVQGPCDLRPTSAASALCALQLQTLALAHMEGHMPGGRHGSPLQRSYLENPMDRGAWQAMARGEAKGQI